MEFQIDSWDQLHVSLPASTLEYILSFGGLCRFADSPLPNDYLASRSCFALARHPERIGNFIFTIKEKVTRKFLLSECEPACYSVETARRPVSTMSRHWFWLWPRSARRATRADRWWRCVTNDLSAANGTTRPIRCR